MDTDNIPNNLEDVNPNNNPYVLLEKAIENMNNDMLIKLSKLCEEDLYLAMMLSSFDKILTEGSDEVLFLLGSFLERPEYVDLYNKLYAINEFRKAVKNREIGIIMEIFCKIDERLMLPYLVKYLDNLLKDDRLEVSSQLATYFVGSEYIEEYNQICDRIKEIIGKNYHNSEPPEPILILDSQSVPSPVPPPPRQPISRQPISRSIPKPVSWSSPSIGPVAFSSSERDPFSSSADVTFTSGKPPPRRVFKPQR